VPTVIDAPPSSEWPFRHPLCPDLPDGEVVLRASHVEDACVNAQSGTQLVTTQKSYLDAEWARALAQHGRARLVVSEGTATHGERVTHPLALAFRLSASHDAWNS
jgi:hypothetical protein